MAMDAKTLTSRCQGKFKQFLNEKIENVSLFSEKHVSVYFCDFYRISDKLKN